MNLQHLGEGQGRAIVAPREARGGLLSGATRLGRAIQGIAILLGACLRATVLLQVPERYQGLIRRGPHHLQLNQCFSGGGFVIAFKSVRFVHAGCVLVISNW